MICAVHMAQEACCQLQLLPSPQAAGVHNHLHALQYRSCPALQLAAVRAASGACWQRDGGKQRYSFCQTVDRMQTVPIAPVFSKGCTTSSEHR